MTGSAVARIVWSSTAGSIASTMAANGMATARVSDRGGAGGGALVAGWAVDWLMCLSLLGSDKARVTQRLVLVKTSCGYTAGMPGATTSAEARRPGLRERKKQQTRQLIAETARRLFTERGFERVTVAEIARAADVSDQTVFNYFPTKEELVYWRLGSFEEELLSTIREREPEESIVAAFGRFLLAQRGLLGQSD